MIDAHKGLGDLARSVPTRKQVRAKPRTTTPRISRAIRGMSVRLPQSPQRLRGPELPLNRSAVACEFVVSIIFWVMPGLSAMM